MPPDVHDEEEVKSKERGRSSYIKNQSANAYF